MNALEGWQMFDEWEWSPQSIERNELTARYEPIQVEVLRHLTRWSKEVVFVDVGANVGAYSIMMANEPTVVKIHAIEALQALSEEIQRNIRINSLESRITLHNIAVSDSRGTRTFLERGGYAGDSGVQETHHSPHGAFQGVRELEVTSLDELLCLEGLDVVLKIDVEGHEDNVLRGAHKTLESCRGFLQVEILDGDKLDSARKLLSALDWHEIFHLDRDYYFSNVLGAADPAERLELLEDGLALLIHRARTGVGRPTRKRLFGGVVVEADRRTRRRVSRVFRRRKANQDLETEL